MEEQKLQRKIIAFFEKNGFFVVKIIKANINGLPDIILLKNGRSVFMEVKKDTKTKACPLQEYRLGQLREMGFNAYVVGDFDVNFLNLIVKNT
jgi:Holliday junction resolvase